MFIRRPLTAFLILFLFNVLSGQKYDVKIWGVDVGKSEITFNNDDEISLTIQADELINVLYTLDYEFTSIYNNKDYSVIESEKIVKQGTDKQKYHVEYLDGEAIYKDGDNFQIDLPIYSYLSLLTKIINSPIYDVDTKWFNLENEGIVYKARPLWNDTTTVTIDNDEYFCDHYRIDMKIVSDDNNIFNETDYFNELFFDINSIRQIWVETWQKQRKIVKIAVKNRLINLEIVIAN